MRLKDHVKYSIIPTAGFSFIDWFYALIFFVTAVFVYIYHVFEYFMKTRDLNIKRMFRFYESLLYEFREGYYLGISIFHTVEILLIVILAAFYTKIGQYILAGLLFHHCLDSVFLIKKRCLFKRSYSIIYYLYVSQYKRSEEFVDMQDKEREIFEGIVNKF